MIQCFKIKQCALWKVLQIYLKKLHTEIYIFDCSIYKQQKCIFNVDMHQDWIYLYIHVVISDNGTEYTSNYFKSVFLEN